jgi:DNA polymerase III epsilon subunit family exonuclease
MQKQPHTKFKGHGRGKRFTQTEVAPETPQHPLRPQWLYKTPHEINIVFFDLETTGGNPQNASVTEIAAIRYENGEEKSRFQTLVNPERHIPRRVQELTGIKPDHVKDAPAFRDVIADFLSFVGDAVLVSHGVISDFAFVEHGAREYLGQEIKNYYICTHLLVSNFMPEIPNKSLSGVATHFGTPPAKAHRAEADAEMTASVFWSLYENLAPNGFSYVESLLKLQADQQTIRRLGAGILAKEIEDKAPTTPGIFYLYNGQREISFLSAAANLKKTLHDTMRLGDEREFNKLLVDSRDFKFERMPHYLLALLKEKDHLKRLNLPIDPRKLQGRANGFVQIFITQDIVDLADKNPDAIPFPVPRNTQAETLQANLRHTAEFPALSPDVAPPTSGESASTAFLQQHLNESDESSIPVRNAQRLKLVRRLDKYQIDRTGDDSVVTHGALQEGIGWSLGPFEKPKEVANSLKQAISEAEIDSPNIGAAERAARLWELVSLMSGVSASPTTRTENRFFMNFSNALARFMSAKKSDSSRIGEIVKKHKLAFDETKLPRTGIAVISNPESKELDIAVFVKGTQRKIMKLAPEDSGKLSSSRFFTRLFENFHDDVTSMLNPILFTEDKCIDTELLSIWIRSREGEWADFSQLASLYQPEQHKF